MRIVMERNALNKLIEWKNSEDKNPLIIRGARQVGKSWLMKEFGEKYYQKVAYVNFDNNEKFCKFFDEDYDIERIILSLEVETRIIRRPPSSTLFLYTTHYRPHPL